MDTYGYIMVILTVYPLSLTIAPSADTKPSNKWKVNKINIYKIYQTVNHGYDVYTSAVVIAEDENQARIMHPSDGRFYCLEVENGLKYEYEKFHSEWVYPEDVIVEYWGTASTEVIETIVLCSDYVRG